MVLRIKSKNTMVFLLGALCGLFIFFPWNPLKQKLAKYASDATGASIDIGSLSASTGFFAGLSRGSVFGIKGSNVSLQHPVGLRLHCERLYLAPRLLPLLIGDLQLGVKCKLKDGAYVAALVKLYPFWSAISGNFKGLDADLEASKFSLGLLAGLPGAEGLSGLLTGDVTLKKIDMSGASWAESLEWSLEVDQLQTPGVEDSLITLPPMSFSEAESQGTLTPSSLNLEKLSLGSAANPLEAHLKLADVQLDSQMFPRRGTFSGSIRIDPLFERERLGKISWDSAFGPADSQGKRQFKRSAKGQWHTFLLFGPPD